LRRGVTLIELLVAIVVLTVITAVVGLTISESTSSPTSVVAAKLFEARDEALRTGKPVITWIADSGGAAAIAFPDGTVLADSVYVDRFTGRLSNNREISR
jgi:prepilin-type N-terminal cleavage/methylation domain-containing protein